MHDLSIDLETAGTLVTSQILSIGLAMFDLKTGEIGEQLYLPILIDNDQQINATVGTFKFQVNQTINNPKALEGLLDSYEINHEAIPLHIALIMIDKYCQRNMPQSIWANGTKFDIGMLEYQFQQHNLEVPWHHSSDRCMRTLRQFAGRIDVDYEGVAHNALSDAIWQAKYIRVACNKLKLV